jgi:hypothetical protein
MLQGRVGGPNDSAEIAEGFFIDTVISEKLRVVTKISKKLVESPESSLRAAQPTTEGSSFGELWFENGKLQFHKGLLRMPPIDSEPAPH